MFQREIMPTLERYLKTFPVVILTGARQVGKTTLLRNELKKTHSYVLLENPSLRAQALEDMESFLQRHPPPIIFDEFQNIPPLTNYLQGIVDENRKLKGQYILTGSHSFHMMEQITQSLAGRAGILSLYGLSTRELSSVTTSFDKEEEILTLLLRGSFPQLWAEPEIRASDWYGSYLSTYLERDVRNLAQVGDLLSFQNFLRQCAIRTGQILNLSEVARDSGISQPTAKRWLSILQATYQVHLVQPYYENLSSRLRKAPKLYFMDPGLACYLMGFQEPTTLLHSPQLGALFETLVITNFIRLYSAGGPLPEHYYLQTKRGLEVDLMLQEGNRWRLFEIKYRRTITQEDLKQLLSVKELLIKKNVQLTLLAPIPKSWTFLNCTIQPWFEVKSD